MKRPEEVDDNCWLQWQEYANHLEQENKDLQWTVAKLQAKVMMQTSKILDGGHTGEYRPVPRREDEET